MLKSDIISLWLNSQQLSLFIYLRIFFSSFFPEIKFDKRIISLKLRKCLIIWAKWDLLSVRRY